MPRRADPTLDDVEEGTAGVLLYCPHCQSQEISYLFSDVEVEPPYNEQTDAVVCVPCARVLSILDVNARIIWI